MKLSKKKSTSLAKWFKLSPKKIKLLAYAIFATVTILLAISWLVRDRIWNMNEILKQQEELSQVKAILRVQSDLLQEAVKDMSGLRDVMLLETAQARALGARAMLSTDRDRAVLDEILVSLQKDAEEIAKDQSLPDIAKREKIKDAAWRLRSDLVGLFGPEFFKGKVEIIRVKSRLDEDESGMRDEVGSHLDGATNPWSASSSRSSSSTSSKAAAGSSDDSAGDQDVVIENDDLDENDDEDASSGSKKSAGSATTATTKKLRSASTNSFGTTSKKKKSSKSGGKKTR